MESLIAQIVMMGISMIIDFVTTLIIFYPYLDCRLDLQYCSVQHNIICVVHTNCIGKTENITTDDNFKSDFGIRNSAFRFWNT